MSENTTPVAPSTPVSDANPAESPGSPQEIVKDPSQPLTAEEMFELKVNGKQLKLNKSEVLRRAQLGEAAHEKFEQASKLNKEAKAIIDRAKTNPLEALMDPALGLSKEQIRKAFEEWYHKEWIETEGMTDEQRELAEYRKQKASKEKAEAEAKAKAEAEAEENAVNELTQKEQAILQAKLIDAMEEAGLPKTKAIAGRMAFYMKQALENKWDDVSPAIIADQVRKETFGMTRSLGDSSTAEQLIAMFGDSIIDKIRKHDLEQLRKKRGVDTLSRSSDLTDKSTKVDYDTVDQRLRAMRMGKG